MRVVWTAPAAEDLYSITRYIAHDNPSAARKVLTAIRQGCSRLIEMPHQGRVGRSTEHAS